MFTGYRKISADGSQVGRIINVPPKVSYSHLLSNTCIATSGVLVDRSVFGDFRMKEVYYDDFVCWLELLRVFDVFAYGLNQDLFRYRVMARSVSSNKLKSAREVWLVYRTIEKISFARSILLFLSYSVRGFFKHIRF